MRVDPLFADMVKQMTLAMNGASKRRRFKYPDATRLIALSTKNFMNLVDEPPRKTDDYPFKF